mmetsp:Transcript_8601/g.13429  ORF Transcript_8601/g.13429 Transcript_8601/m.13429 type:complete len:87 (+) Transcript_8601:116-376(+)
MRTCTIPAKPSCDDSKTSIDRDIPKNVGAGSRQLYSESFVRGSGVPISPPTISWLVDTAVSKYVHGDTATTKAPCQQKQQNHNNDL